MAKQPKQPKQELELEQEQELELEQEQELELEQEQELELEQVSTYPFETCEATKIAWLAGLLQSEATFTVDDRARSKSGDPDYIPPPPIPIIKLDMIEKDLMEYIGKLVDQKVLLLNRKTTAENQVYRVTVQARKKTERLLKAIIPYTVGEKNRSRILELLSICEAYNKWKAEGGKSKAASLAARSKQKKETNTE